MTEPSQPPQFYGMEAVPIEMPNGERILYLGPPIREDDPDRNIIAASRMIAAGYPCAFCAEVLHHPNRAARRSAKRRGEILHVTIAHQNNCEVLAYSRGRRAA